MAKVEITPPSELPPSRVGRFALGTSPRVLYVISEDKGPDKLWGMLVTGGSIGSGTALKDSALLPPGTKITITTD